MVNPVSYWRLKDRYFNLVGSKCKKCGAEWFPPVKVCRKCGSQDVADSEMPHTGKIVAHTVLREPSDEFKRFAPYIIGPRGAGQRPEAAGPDRGRRHHQRAGRVPGEADAEEAHGGLEEGHHLLRIQVHLPTLDSCVGKLMFS